MAASRRFFGFLAAILFCPISAYVLTWLSRDFEQLLSGRGFHPFHRFFGIGSISMLSFGCHQWSPLTIFIYYIICLAVALPLFAVARHRVGHRRAVLCVNWAIACGTYFFLLALPYSFDWRMGLYGTLAGAIAGLLHYFIAYLPTSRSA